MAECHRRDVKVIAMVTTVADAITVEAAGVDAVVAQGAEAGGHRAHFEKPASPERGAVGTLALVPQLVDSLRVPVIAAGGIADGRGLVAALALGATGVLMGTRFVATRESMAFAAFKKALLEESGEDTSITDAFTGRYARVLPTAFVERYGRTALGEDRAPKPSAIRLGARTPALATWRYPRGHASWSSTSRSASIMCVCLRRRLSRSVCMTDARCMAAQSSCSPSIPAHCSEPTRRL